MKSLSHIRGVLSSVKKLLLRRDDKFEGMVESDGCQTPHSMLPVTKHWDGVSILVAGAEVCVATVLRVTQVGQGQAENLLHLGQKQAKKAQFTTLDRNKTSRKHVF